MTKARQPLNWWLVVLAVAVVVAVAWIATSWLLNEADQAKDPAAARVEAIKTGLSIGAGTGGVFALLLAVRRQWHQEITSIATELDAAEKRVTELYTKAVEQLGSDKAPVRLGGLYALERVADNNPSQRQTIVNVLCAYLRMPFDLSESKERREELEVRLTAQRLLTRHLTPRSFQSNPDYWGPHDIDLTGAVLVNFALEDCEFFYARFESAIFEGSTSFEGTKFVHEVGFQAAAFRGPADFQRTQFCHAYRSTFVRPKYGLQPLFQFAVFENSANFFQAKGLTATDFVGAAFAKDRPPEVTTPRSGGLQPTVSED